MIGNRLIVRMEKDKNKPRRKRDQWEPPCDCDVVEIQRPTSKEGPKILSECNDNRILFRLHSKSQLNARDDSGYKPQAIAYKVGSCRGGENTNDQCRTITVYPQLGGPGSQEVHSDRITDGSQDVFLLKIKKKPESVEQKKRNIEVELRTPKASPVSPAVVSEATTRPDAKLDVRDEKKADVDGESKKESRRKRKKKK